MAVAVGTKMGRWVGCQAHNTVEHHNPFCWVISGRHTGRVKEMGMEALHPQITDTATRKEMRGSVRQKGKEQSRIKEVSSVQTAKEGRANAGGT